MVYRVNFRHKTNMKDFKHKTRKKFRHKTKFCTYLFSGLEPKYWIALDAHFRICDLYQYHSSGVSIICKIQVFYKWQFKDITKNRDPYHSSLFGVDFNQFYDLLCQLLHILLIPSTSTIPSRHKQKLKQYNYPETRPPPSPRQTVSLQQSAQNLYKCFSLTKHSQQIWQSHTKFGEVFVASEIRRGAGVN